MFSFNRVSKRRRFAKWAAKTIFLGSIIIPIDYFGLLGWLDNLILTLSQYDQRIQNQSHAPESKLPITVIEISQEMYEKHFYNTSPLASGLISKLILKVTEASPDSLSIDFDVSPNTFEDREIIATAMKEVSSGSADVVLALPFGSNTIERYQAKLAWVYDMCDLGIQFGEPIVLHYNRTALKLAKIDKSSPPTLYEQTAIVNGNSTKKSLCDSLKMTNPSYSVDARLYGVTNSFSDELNSKGFDLINFTLADRLNVVRLDKFEDLNELTEVIKGHTVFLGGAYGTSDFFYIGGERVSGVHLQALNYASLLQPIKSSSYFTFITEVIFGIVFLAVSSALWRRRQDCEKHRRSYSKRIILDTLNIVFTISFVWFIVAFVSPYFLTYSLWLNPAPIIAALILDTYLIPISTISHKSSTIMTGIDFFIYLTVTGGKLCLGIWGAILIILG